VRAHIQRRHARARATSTAATARRSRAAALRVEHPVYTSRAHRVHAGRLQVAPPLHQVLLKLVSHLVHSVALSCRRRPLGLLTRDEFVEANEFLKLGAITQQVAVLWPLVHSAATASIEM